MNLQTDSYNYTLAEVLKGARIEKNLSISEVELQTKIRASYITALENSEYEKLPADIYVRGILKNYAIFLNLHYGDLLRLYRKEGTFLGINPNDKKYYLNLKSFFSSLVVSHKLISSVVFVLISVIILIYLYSNYSKMVAPPFLDVNLSENVMNVRIPQIIVEGHTDLNSTVLINGQKIAINNEGLYKELFHLTSGSNKIIIQSVSNRNNKTSILEREIVFTETEMVESNGVNITSGQDAMSNIDNN